MNNFDEATQLLPKEISALLLSMPQQIQKQVTELRVRKDKPLIIMLDTLVCFFSSSGKLVNHFSENCLIIDSNQFDEIFAKLCSYSVHSHMDTLVEGFVTADSGNRTGIAATAVIKNGEISSIKDVTSFNIRIAKNIVGCARNVLNSLYVTSFPSIIVASPPGGGKTTFLRDFVKTLSSGFAGNYKKVTVVDERFEIAAFDVGINTDVIRGYPKAKAIEIAVRTLSPDIIVCDEIANDLEVESIKSGFSSGVSFAVSVHIKKPEDVLRKSVINRLIETGEFDYLVLLEHYGDEFSVFDLRSCKYENIGDSYDYCFFNPDGDFNDP